MSDIRSFFGGKASAKVVAPQTAAPAAIQPDVPMAAAGSCSTVNKNNENNETPDSSNSGISVVISTALPADVEKIITWKSGEPVPYLALVEIFEQISKVGGRLEKENLFSRLFRAVISTTPEDLDSIVYLASNEVSPVYDGKELGIGDSLLVKAVCEATGRKKDAVEEAYEKEGDLGTVALMSRANQKTLSFAAKPKPLLARFVLEQFRQITQIKGDKAQGRKVEIIKALMVKCQGSEAKFIVRALQGKLRIGTAQQTVLVALAHAASDAQLDLTKGSVMEPVRRILEQQAAGWSCLGAHSTAAEEKEAGDSDAEEEDEEERVVVKRTSKQRQQPMDVDEDDAAAPAPVPVPADTAAVWETSIATPVTAEVTEGELAASAVIADETVDLGCKIEAVNEKCTPESVKLKTFALALYCAANHSDTSARARAASKAHQLLPKDLRYQCAEIAVKRAFSECPNLSLLVKHLLQQPLHMLYRHSCLSIGLPVAPMLAKPTKEIGEVLRRLSGLAFTMEYKYDGERAQVHLLEDGSVKIYSRNSEDNSEKYPDLRDIVKTARKSEVTSCILDAEVVAYDREQKCLLPFQVLSTRKRKVEAGEEDNQKVKVILQIFDLLFINGKSLLRESLRTRRTLMEASFNHTEGMLHFANGLDHVENGDTAPIETFLQEACAAQCEGLMVKTLDDNASYEPSKRSLNWLKLKKDYIDGMGVCDSVDLVVIGGYLGRGKRVNTYGAYLVACYDPERDEYQSVCKVGTGFKDEDLARLYTQMQEHIIGSHRRPLNYNVNDVLTPDHWFDAAVVWELQAADLSKSSAHTGGAGRIDSGRGIGLRFPRYLRSREDKRADQATTAEQIVDMFHNQGLAGEGGASGNNGDDAGGADEDDWL